MEQGVILKGIGGFYYVKLEGRNEICECKARGRFRLDHIKPMVGDWVQVNVAADGKGYLDEIMSRKNMIIRPAIANVDCAFVVVTPKDPEPNLFLIDKIIAICEIKNIEPIVVINKTDLAKGDEIEEIYKKAGLTCIQTSTVTGVGIEKIKELMQERISFFSGSSGIGKSSIINLIEKEINMEVGVISEKISRGKNTTRHVELFPLKGGGYIADTPGFSSFDVERLEAMKKDELIFGFRDIEKYDNTCQFTGCSHTCEKGCRVLAAVEQGEISESRISSYKKLYEELKNIKEWAK